MVNKVNVVFGGWYQRTTLHLSEVHRFLLHGTSDLDLNKVKLKNLRNKLILKSVKRVVGYLEYLEIETRSGIKVKYFEDGLYTLSKEGSDVAKTKKQIKDYFDERFSPAISYLFSLGAPTPKILSNMKETHPFVIERVVSNPMKSKVGKEFGDVYMESKSNRIKVSKTRDNIVIDVTANRKRELEMLTEMQIFFSDFKLQLHKYLDIHRKIWEEISEVKEKEFIRGEDVSKHKTMLDSYQKSVQLIMNRINQMSNYAKTRMDISERVRIHRNLNDLFQYRFEDLFNTLEYIKEVWNMTLDYVNSAIRIMDDVGKKASSNGLKSIQLLISVGVIAGIVRYLKPGSGPFPDVSPLSFILGMFVVAFGFDWIIKKIAKKKKYELKFVERVKKI